MAPWAAAALAAAAAAAASAAAQPTTEARDPGGDELALLQLQVHQNVQAGPQRAAPSQVEQTPLPEHYWPHARGPAPAQYGATGYTAPHDLGAALAWSWHHPGGRYHTVICGGPVIDNAKNLYLTTNDGVRKFNKDGQVQWHYKTPGVINNEASLMGDAVYGSTQTGHVFSVDLKTGQELWVKQVAPTAGPDAGYPAGYDDVFIAGAEVGKDPKSPGGNQRVIALEGRTGETLWEFRPDHPVWNLTPLFPGDGTCVFMDFSGGLYRVGLRNGTLLWHAHAQGSEDSFTDGGATLGTNGVAYTCSNLGRAMGQEGTKGALRAYRLADGHLLWERLLPQPCNSYPAVGSLGDGEALSVVVTPGSFMGRARLHGSVVAFDAETGAPRWGFQAPRYSGPLGMARGDVEGFTERLLFDPGHVICLPAHWSSANIAGDGAVYAARADGLAYVLQGPPAGGDAAAATDSQATFLSSPDFATSPGVNVTRFDAGGASLHGAFAFAPGLTAMATCDTLYVFKS